MIGAGAVDSSRRPPLVADEGKPMPVLPSNLAPLQRVDRGKRRVAVRREIDVGDLQCGRARPGQTIDFTTPEHPHGLPGSKRGIERGIDVAEDAYAGRLPLGVARDDERVPPRQRTADGVEGPPPHDEHAAHGQVLEARQVTGDPPRNVVVGADDTVAGDCRDGSDGRGLRGGDRRRRRRGPCHPKLLLLGLPMLLNNAVLAPAGGQTAMGAEMAGKG